MNENKIDQAIVKTANKIDSAVDEAVTSKYVGMLVRGLIAAVVSYLCFVVIFLTIDEWVFGMGEAAAGLISVPLSLLIFVAIFKLLKKRK